MATATELQSQRLDNSQKARIFKAGTRKSKLALAQADIVASALRQAWPSYEFQIHGHNTAAGDIDKITPFKDMPVKNIWTHDLERLLVEKELDLLVHSLKDVPTQMAPSCSIGAIPLRGDPRDALVVKEGHHGQTLADLPPGAVVGTSSIRRTAQVALKYPHLRIHDIRGNVPTRLSKLDATDGPFDALILAAAGLIRLDLTHRISQYLDSENGGMLYAVGQGAIGVEMREDDDNVRQLLAAIDHQPTSLACFAERSLLRTLEGGCSAPLGVETAWDPNQEQVLKIKAIVVSVDGKESAEMSQKGVVNDPASAEQFGHNVANDLLRHGAGKILAEIKERKRPTEVIEI